MIRELSDTMAQHPHDAGDLQLQQLSVTHQQVKAENAFSITVRTNIVGGREKFSFFLEVAGGRDSIPRMCLRLGDVSLRPEVYYNAWREMTYAKRQTAALYSQWEVHWGISTVPPSKHHACPDFSRFYFSGVPGSEAEKLFLFLYGHFSKSLQENWTQKIRAYRVKYDDSNATLEGLVDLDLGPRKREAFNYHFWLPWIEYFEDTIQYEGRNDLSLRPFHGQFLKKEDFDSKIPNFVNAVGEGILQPRGFTASEEQAELEWSMKRGEMRGQGAEGEPSRRVAQRTDPSRSVRESMIAQEEAIREQGNAARIEIEQGQREAQK